MQTSESRDEYLRAKREARDAVRNAKNEEWIKLGESLQNDFSQNQRRFWARVRTSVKGRPEVGRICARKHQDRIGAASKVIGAMRSEILERRELSKGQS